MSLNYNRGMVQEVKHGTSAGRLWFTTTLNGLDVTPDAAPEIEVREQDGDVIVSATSMTVATVTKEGLLNYDGQTAEFTVGEIVTGGTSGATAVVKAQEKDGASGTLYLANVDGTFQNNEAITGSYSGAATVDETIYSRDYYYDLDASNTNTWDIGENYHARITFDVDSVEYEDWVYFDVTFYPYHPVITDTILADEHPDWSRFLPEGWQDWKRAIMAGQRALSERIRGMGSEYRASFFVRREDLRFLELAFVEHEIAKRATGMSPEDRDYWKDNREAAWSAKREKVYDQASDDSDIDSDPVVIRSRLVR